MQYPISPSPIESPPTRRPERAWLRRLPLVAILCSAVIGAILLRDEMSLDSLAQHHQDLMAFRDAHYVLAVVGFVLAYIAIVVLSLPGALVASLTGGLLFGLALGTVYNVVAAGTGALGVFLAARAGIGSAVTDRLQRHGGASLRMMERLRKNEWSMLFLMRLVPIVPFFLANLVPAVVGIGFWRFAISTYLGIIPAAILITSIGSGLGEVFARGETPDFSLLHDPAVYLPILGLLALAAVPLLLNSKRKDH